MYSNLSKMNQEYIIKGNYNSMNNFKINYSPTNSYLSRAAENLQLNYLNMLKRDINIIKSLGEYLLE